MTRVQRVVGYFTALFILAAMTGLIGCSGGGDGATAPPAEPEITANGNPATGPTGDSDVLGFFQFVFDDDGSVSIEGADRVRGAEVNVTPFVSLVLEGIWWDEENRNWHLEVGLKNVSVFTGYDVWIILHTLGPKMVLNPDGYIWILPPFFPDPTRCAFIAYGKDNVDRAYPPGFYDVREIIFHQPEGIPKLAPIGFWVDATGVPRRTPGVEDLHLEAIDEANYHLTAFIWDHQSPSEDLIAWADTSHFNGNTYEPLYDDGEHGDGAAGDNIFGCYFEGNPDKGWYRVVIYAFDSQQNQGENDIWFWHGEPCDDPLEPIPFEILDKGEHSGIQYPWEVMITNFEEWMDVWQEHASIWFPPPPPPPVNFELHNVIGIWVGARPSNNHMVHVTSVMFDPCEQHVIVSYDFTPYKGCGPLTVMTNPYEMIMLPKFEWPVIYVGTEVDCPGPPPECIEDMWFDTVDQGFSSGITYPYEKRFSNWEQFEPFWHEHASIFYPPPPMPDINFEDFDLYAVGIGERNTGGFIAEIFNVCWMSDQSIGVFYKELIPGPGCNVPMVFTQPYHWVLVHKQNSGTPVHWFPHAEVYSCGGCEPIPFFPIAEGHHSCAEPGEYGFQFEQDYWNFWLDVNCYDDNSGDPPPPLPPDPPPMNPENIMIHTAIQLPWQPTTGYYVTIDEVCLEGCLIKVEYTEHVPGQNCEVLPIETKPWVIAAVEVPPIECVFGWEFIRHEEIYDCPPCYEVPWYQLADNEWGCAEPGEYGFKGFSPEFEQLWYDLNCWTPDLGIPPPPLPDIPPPMEPGWETKPFAVQLDERPTDGFFLTIDYVCLEGCTAVVHYTENIPGPNCPVNDVITKPWVFGVAEFPPIDCEIVWEFVKSEVVYDCPDDCWPLDFWETAAGQHGCADPGAYGWQYLEPYHVFWLNVKCYDPGSGEDPPPLPEDPPPGPNMLINHLGIQLPGRPSTGYYLSIDKVCIEGCDVFVEYTEHIPGPDCIVMWIATKPWIIAAVEMPAVYCLWTWHFTKYEDVYSCDDPDCWDFETIGDGIFGPMEPGGWYFDNPNSYYHYWAIHHPGEPQPPINFEGGYGGYAIHLGERPTSGFEVEVFEICYSDEPFGAAVRWVEWIPGASCGVDQVLTHPWTLVTFPLVDLPYFDEGYEEVYECE